MTNIKPIIWGLVVMLALVALIGSGCRSRFDKFREYRDQRREQRNDNWDDWRKQWSERERWFDGDRQKWFRRKKEEGSEQV